VGGKVVDVRGGQGARPRVDTGTKESQSGQKESENELHVGSVVSQRLERIVGGKVVDAFGAFGTFLCVRFARLDQVSLFMHF